MIFRDCKYNGNYIIFLRSSDSKCTGRETVYLTANRYEALEIVGRVHQKVRRIVESDNMDDNPETLVSIAVPDPNVEFINRGKVESRSYFYKIFMLYC